MSSYVVITRDMLDLGLRGSRLLAYALIYGFCQDGESNFHGSHSYVAAWCGLSRSQATSILKGLVDDGYLVREEVDGCLHYTLGKMPVLENQPAKLENQPAKLENQHNKIEDNIDDNLNIKTSSTRTRVKDVKFPWGDKVLMTTGEFDALVASFGDKDAHRLIEILDDYLVNHPRKQYASHYRAILSWCVTRLQEEKLTEQRLRNAEEAGQRYAPQSIPANQPRTTYAEAQRRQAEIDAKYPRKNG